MPTRRALAVCLAVPVVVILSGCSGNTTKHSASINEDLQSTCASTRGPERGLDEGEAAVVNDADDLARLDLDSGTSASVRKDLSSGLTVYLANVEMADSGPRGGGCVVIDDALHSNGTLGVMFFRGSTGPSHSVFVQVGTKEKGPFDHLQVNGTTVPIHSPDSGGSP